MQQKNVEVTVIEVNKTAANSNKDPEVRAVVNIEIVKTITLYKYYPSENGNYDIPKEHNSPVQYGSKIKALAIELMVGNNNSTDATKNIISSITDSHINLSKGTLVNWMNSCAQKLEPQLSKIIENLLESYYMNNDESQITINAEKYNTLCACNDKYVKLWISKQKSRSAIDDLNFLTHFTGIIIKDGTDLYNPYGKALAQCVAHILRYLKGIYQFNEIKGSKAMREFLKEVVKLRQKLIEKEKTAFSKSKYNMLMEKFNNIFKSWKREWMHSTIENNEVYDEERKLLARFEDPVERKQILFFLADFKVPATNNLAESSLRPIKIKQKIGKFRSVKGAELYADIKSCNLTYKKHTIPTFEALVRLFDNQPILV